ncbi:Ig-like domain-containing protein [Psychrobacillus sp. FSL H8-0487]|uniref:Ig-like domain-containing protein n=1 Tax=Psychrobacillus sp. FSL H8-0487 TaxID=2921391 RepID=UPI0030FC70E1
MTNCPFTKRPKSFDTNGFGRFLFQGNVTGSATNLKEVVVTFDGTVTKENAEEKSNYSLKSGKAIKSVVLSEDAKLVTITVEGTLANNKADAVSVSNFLDAKNVEFTTVDNTLPVVESIKSLGTKSLKVIFSEPVTDLKQSNFTLDGKAYFGKVDLGANNRSVILTPFSSSSLAVGAHKVSISGVKDFAGFVSLVSTHDFTAVEATATLESVVLTFSEDVDPSTISASKVYWKSGDSKKTATGTVEALADNKFKYTFSTANSLPTGTVDIHVEGVKDYSGNEIAKDTKVSVKPEIDQTRPEVNKVSGVDATTIKVTFSKAINAASAEDVKNYTVLNKDGKVISVQSAGIDPTDNKSVIVNLYSALSTGENTLTIKNLKDNTKLQNTMLIIVEKLLELKKQHHHLKRLLVCQIVVLF